MRRKTAVKRLVMNSMLIALSVVLTRYLSIRIPFFGVEGVRIGVGALPIFLAGFMYDPVDGFVVGALADVAGFLVSPIGAYMPQFTLTSALTGWIPAMVYKYAFKRKLTFVSLMVATGIGQFITDIIMVPYFLNSLFGVPYAVLMPSRFVGFPVMLFVYPFLIIAIMKRVPIFGDQKLAVSAK